MHLIIHNGVYSENVAGVGTDHTPIPYSTTTESYTVNAKNCVAGETKVGEQCEKCPVNTRVSDCPILSFSSIIFEFLPQVPSFFLNLPRLLPQSPVPLTLISPPFTLISPTFYRNLPTFYCDLTTFLSIRKCAIITAVPY